MSKNVTFAADTDLKDSGLSAEPDLDDLFPDDAPAADPEETREQYLARASSGYTKVRHSFIQQPKEDKNGSVPGTLAQFSRNHRAAVLYLAILTNWPWLSRETDPLPADAWIRFLSGDGHTAPVTKAKGSAPLTWTPQSLSHAWSVLEGFDLVSRPRKGRLKEVELQREDGSGVKYTSPVGANGDAYFVLPNEFWTKQLHCTLSWPALAVLLILLKETGVTPSAPLAIDRAQEWYGISRTVAEQGLSELRGLDLLASRQRYVQDVNSSEGRRQTSLHALLGDFSTKRRGELRGAAKDRVDRRSALGKPIRKEESKDGTEEAKRSAETP